MLIDGHIKGTVVFFNSPSGFHIHQMEIDRFSYVQDFNFITAKTLMFRGYVVAIGRFYVSGVLFNIFRDSIRFPYHLSSIYYDASFLFEACRHNQYLVLNHSVIDYPIQIYFGFQIYEQQSISSNQCSSVISQITETHKRICISH